ncbi:MAG: hypothetical protein RQ966_15445, partial [Acetobacteraceae bacterium]|nr:hypothetical protein [Acetobacteraceae bacterium]
GCLFATFTLLSLYQIALVRTAVGPWYVAIAALFWIGLFINAVVLFERMRSTLSVRLAAGACTAVVSALYASANYSFASKTPFLQSRALSADSCMRAYKTAPTFCEMIVFIWPPTYEFASFGRFFDEAGLGASGRYETDTLQGDWVLNTVRLQQRPDRPQIQWDAPGTYSRGRPANWLTAQPLSLALPAGQSLTWEPIRPPVVVSEVLRSSVENHSSGPATLRVSVLHDGKAQVVRNVEMRVGERIELSEDLATTMAGGDKLLLAAESEDADGYLSLYYPRIDIDRVRPKTVRVTQKYRDIQGVPDNAEFSPHPEFSNTPNDAIFRAPEAAPVWDQMYNDLFKPVGGAPCIGDADAFKVSIAVPANISTRMIRLLVGARKYTGDYRQSEVQIPLLADGGMHTYTVPVRFYDLDARDRFESARIYSWSGVGTVEQQQTPVEIKELRLVAHPPVDGSACRP